MTGSLQWTDYTAFYDGMKPARERIVAEAALSIHVNGRHLATAMLTPRMKKEFVAGYLFGQGIIGGAADIRSLSVKGNRAEVTVSVEKTAPLPDEINSGLKASTAEIFNAVRAILKSELFAETEAVHSAGLFTGMETICITEDIGRHNALDKAIGYGLLNNVDFSRVIASSTGRQPLEMVTKCLRAGIPVITTKGVPTALAVATAEKAGLTIAGLVRGKSMIIYSRPDRITDD